MLESVRIPFFQDVLTLTPGEDWQNSIYKRIEQSDLFLLFWSTAARESKRVMREVRYALRCKQDDAAAPPEIIPVPIEGPPPVPPPRGLEHIHFNDHLLYFMRFLRTAYIRTVDAARGLIAEIHLGRMCPPTPHLTHMSGGGW